MIKILQRRYAYHNQKAPVVSIRNPSIHFCHLISNSYFLRIINIFIPFSCLISYYPFPVSPLPLSSHICPIPLSSIPVSLYHSILGLSPRLYPPISCHSCLTVCLTVLSDRVYPHLPLRLVSSHPVFILQIVSTHRLVSHPFNPFIFHLVAT